MEILDPIRVVNVHFRQDLVKYSDYSAKLSYFVFAGYHTQCLQFTASSDQRRGFRD